MTYQDAQVWSQLAALVIFLSLAVGIAIYTFRPANKAKFERAAKLPLLSDNDETVN
ncbi:MAG TPA: cbb3-type cytochrome c oxidase subunit 3 [Hyphomicrobium sp.]|jgi:cbb3-type cytochrome oxidase subunit 3|nr:cbb3-type cytochrome c oxidase subunit 3 [Hyphomicrobium sp.]